MQLVQTFHASRRSRFFIDTREAVLKRAVRHSVLGLGRGLPIQNVFVDRMFPRHGDKRQDDPQEASVIPSAGEAANWPADHNG